MLFAFAVTPPSLVFAQAVGGAPSEADDADAGCPSLCVDMSNVKSYVNGQAGDPQGYPTCTEGDDGEVKTSFEVETGDDPQTFTYVIEVEKDGVTVSSATATIMLSADTSTVIPVNVPLDDLTGNGRVVTVMVHSPTANVVRSKFFYFRPDYGPPTL